MVNTQPARRTVRIFLASPSADTLDARERVVRVVAAIQADQQYAPHVELDLQRWDDPARPVVCDRKGNPQQDIVVQRGSPADCDLVVGIFANTLGGTLPTDRFQPPAGRSQPWHCSEWEVEQGLAAHKAVWLFHDQRMPPSKKPEVLAQAKAVSDYMDRFNPSGGPMREGYNPFDDDDDFQTRLDHGLRNWLSRCFIDAAPPPPVPPTASDQDATPPDLLGPLTPTQQAVLAQLLLEPGLLLTEAQASSLRHEPAGGLASHLLRRWAEWSTSAGGRLGWRFVRLTLLLDRGLLHEGERYEDHGSFDSLATLLTKHAGIHAWVLVGEPGAGKSTVLQHHELSCARAALLALTAAPSTSEDSGIAPARALPELCIWHRLSEYAHDSPPPAQWLAERWSSELPRPDQLAGRVRVRYLLDALNEIKAPDRAAQLQAIDRWTAWAASHNAGPGALAPLFSVRTLDQSPMSLGTQFEVRQIMLGAWSDDQIRDYCAATLGGDNPLWPQIQADTHLLALSRLPFNLAAQCALFRSLGRPAQDRAELMGGLFWQMLAKRQGDGALADDDLLGPRHGQAWRQVASGRWHDSLYVLPDDQGCLVPWLDHTAQRLQRLGRQVSLPRRDLLAGLPGQTDGASPERWLAAVQSLELLGEAQRDPKRDRFANRLPLRYIHQLWQEFFAARGIRHLVRPQPSEPAAVQSISAAADLPDVAPPPLADLADTLAQLGAQEGLPSPDPSHWQEPVKLAVQLVADPQPWLRHLQRVNLALAGRAAALCRQVVEDQHGPTALDALRQALLARSRDPAVDLRLRIEAGLVLGELGDPRYEERSGPHGRYLWPRQWVAVPGGVYRIGDDASDRANEGPETEVTLAPFAMASAPVTNAEYRCFVEAGGYQDERWWQGDTALRWLKEGVRNETEIDQWRAEFAAIRNDGEAWITDRTALTESAKEQVRTWATQTEAEHETMLDDWYGARRYELPQEWFNPSFNAASQPVVGVCQFEAQAYVAWLCAQRGLPPGNLRLPTEAEWEGATRGPSCRRWPWGDADPEPGQINVDPAHLRRTSPVGVFVEADSPEGLTDLAGNVVEWTLSAYTDQHEASALTTAAPDGLARRVVRGGAWYNTSEYCRAAYRVNFAPVHRGYELGFRLVSCTIQGTAP
jgi:formylglycine-generating enzyme required for sulfatase activity